MRSFVSLKSALDGTRNEGTPPRCGMLVRRVAQRLVPRPKLPLLDEMSEFPVL
jgi:hypothetical protein